MYSSLHQVEEDSSKQVIPDESVTNDKRDGPGRDLVYQGVSHDQCTFTAGKDLASVQAALLALASGQGTVSAGKQGGPIVQGDGLLEEHLVAPPARNMNAVKPQIVFGKLVLRPKDQDKVKDYLKHVRNQAYSVRRPCKHCHEQVGYITYIHIHQGGGAD